MRQLLFVCWAPEQSRGNDPDQTEQPHQSWENTSNAEGDQREADRNVAESSLWTKPRCSTRFADDDGSSLNTSRAGVLDTCRESSFCPVSSPHSAHRTRLRVLRTKWDVLSFVLAFSLTTHKLSTCSPMDSRNSFKNSKQKLLSCWGQTRYFCLLKCSLCQIRRLKSHEFLLCRGRETRQTTLCSPITGKEALATDYYYWQAVVGGKQKIKHASLSAVRSWRSIGCCPLWHTTKRCPMLIESFRAHPMPCVFPIRLLRGWCRVVWPQHYTACSVWVKYASDASRWSVLTARMLVGWTELHPK